MSNVVKYLIFLNEKEKAYQKKKKKKKHIKKEDLTGIEEKRS